MPKTKGAPPNEVTLVYKLIAGAHSFFSLEVPGLAVGSPDMHEAYELAIDGLGQHVSRIWEVPVRYTAVISYEQFADELSISPQSLSDLGFPIKSRINNESRAYA